MKIMGDTFPGAFAGYTLKVTESHQSSKVWWHMIFLASTQKDANEFLTAGLTKQAISLNVFFCMNMPFLIQVLVGIHLIFLLFTV